MKKFIGCDLGGTNLRAAVVYVDSGEIIGNKSIPAVARDGHEAMMQRIADLILDIIQEAGIQKNEIGGVGIGVPGKLDLEKGETLFLPNLPGTWPNVPLRDRLAELTGLPTTLLNDVRAITYGELCFGAGRGIENMVVFAIGTGIGGGLVVNGQLHLGIGGTGGELGHMTIDANGPKCGCGNYGCVEAFASGPAITSMGVKAVTQGLTTSIAKLCEMDLNKINPKLIAKAANGGDQISKEIFEIAGSSLGIAAANMCTSIGPKKIVIAGGVAQAGDLLLDPIRREIKKRVFTMPVEQVEVVQAELGNNSGVIGSACWAAYKQN